MTNIQSIFLGIIEGLTEFLPISSTGHLSLVSHFLGIVQNDNFITFEISIQLGAILAVLFFYWRKFLDIKTLKKLLVAFIPTAIIGLILSKFLKALLTNEILIAVNLIIGGIIIILVERWYERKFASQIFAPEEKNEKSINEISFKQSFILGIAQALAIFPGVSRSGAVIVSGLLMKINRKTLAEFTFLLAVPTMFAATFYSLLKHREILDFANLNNLFLGFVFAFITALVVIKYFLEYIKKHSFIPFGIYRIFIGILILLILL